MNVLDALKNLYVSMGGEDSNDAQTIAEAIDALSEVAGGSSGGGSLPVASADTLGGVKVGDGLAITEQGVLSASGGVLIVTPSYDDGTGDTTLDKTVGEIKAAMEAGVQVIVLDVTDNLDDSVNPSYSASQNRIEMVRTDYLGGWILSSNSGGYSASTLDDYPVVSES